jgi:hypothetical protein
MQVWGAEVKLPAISETQSRMGNVKGSLIEGKLITTYDGSRQDHDWYAVTLAQPSTVGWVVFTHGQVYPNGGWFDASQGKPQVQVQAVKDGLWTMVGELTDYPATTATDNKNLQDKARFACTLATPVTTLSVRVIGRPACGDKPEQSFSSSAGLAVCTAPIAGGVALQSKFFIFGADTIKASERFTLEVRTAGQKLWEKVYVYHSINPNKNTEDASWANVSFSKPLEVRITTSFPPIDSVIVRPLAYGIKPTIKHKCIFLKISKPIQLSIEVNGDKNHSLLLFADIPLKKPSAKPNEKLVCFKKGFHHIGDKYLLNSNTTYYLEEGAYLRGSFYGKGTVENVSIIGLGIIDSGDQQWQHPTKGILSNICFEDGRNITIEGVTCLNAGNFQLKIQSKAENTTIKLKSIKLIGWNGNTDGIHVSDMDWKDNAKVGNAPNTRLYVQNCFIMANDDAILLCDGVSYSEMKDCVIWDKGNGASFCISWGGHNKVDSCLVKNCYVIHKENTNPVFRALHAGEARIQRVRFEDIFIEGNVYTLFGLKITHHKYDPDAGLGSINGITFRNISLQGISTKNFIEGFDAEHQIENITFENLKINGKVITNASEMNLRTNEFVQNLRFSTIVK